VSFWARLDDLRAVAAQHPDGLVDLSQGEPVDPVPVVVRQALTAAADAPGYPQTRGDAALREAASTWLAGSHGISMPPGQILPTIGSKELIGLLPLLLGLGPDDAVVHPKLAYPSYATGARLVGAEPVPADDVTGWKPASASGRRIRLVWLNSPSNPTGQVLPVTVLRRIIDWARDHDVVVAADECYLDYGWEAMPTSILAPAAAGDSPAGVLALHSLSKRSSMAGYRAGLVSGDPGLIARLLHVRREIGLITPAPVQGAMIAALHDDLHVKQQRERYGRRRAALRRALAAAGWTVDHSEAGLFLWARYRTLDGRAASGRLAGNGILATPGDMYGDEGHRHVRISVTASDAQIAAACHRLESSISAGAAPSR